MDRQNSIKIIVGVMLIIMIMAQAQAFAITTSNTEKNPLMIKPGEDGQAWVEYQNMMGGEEIITKTTIITGSEIITNKGEIEKETIIKSGEKNKVIIKIKMPKETTIGETRRIVLKTTSITNNKQLGLGIGSEIEREIVVQAGERTEKENMPPMRQNIDIEKPTNKEYYRFLILFLTLIVVIVITRIIVAMNKKEKK